MTPRRLVLLVVLAVLGTAAQAHAATFAVNSTADGADATPGNGVCAAAGGACTLRAAVGEANALMGADTITVPAGTYDTGSVLTLSSSVTINGAGARTTIVSGPGSGIVFTASSGEAVITGLTIADGGMGLYVTGAEVTLDRVTVRDNSTTGAGNVFGAGMRLDPGAKVLIQRSAITGNGATGATSVYGAGIYANGAQLDLRSTTIAGNTANASTTARGGGIAALGGTVGLRHVTIAGNAATSGTADQYGGNVFLSGTTATTADSIFTAGVAGSAANCYGAFTTVSGRNIDSGTTCAFGAGQLSSTDPQLRALGDAGGPTDALAPKLSSPAVGGAGACHDDGVDQRGVAAPAGEGCDIGAVELSSNVGVTFAQSRASAAPGTDVTFIARVGNTGADAAESVVLDIAPSGHSEVVLAVPSAGSCTTAVRCELGTLEPGASITVTLVLRAGAPGTVGAAAVVSSATPGASPADDRASAAATVTGTDPGSAGAAPVLGALKLSGKARSGKAVRLSATLSKAARLRVSVARLTPGRRSGRSCSRKARRGSRCTITTAVGSLTLAGRAGAQTLTIPAKLGKRKLAPGRYRVVVQATDAEGRRSAARRVTFTVGR